MTEPLRRADFGRRPLAPIREPVPLPPPDRTYDDAAWAVLTRGHRSGDMDDKWHSVVEDDRLYLHRSWTGRGVYEVAFEPRAVGWVPVAAVVENDRTSYRRDLGDAEESELLGQLIDLQIARESEP